ncbi:FAD:protein FMN transferase [Streptomyces sp. NBC_00669]|uniref:FAD:protein FMN transferase n=1 Tax=Streptomyces sp. NBC_00669 TaxID=2976011 RepID=UPI002E35A769|nr:FAD:protein FMN transferase [Streptomyces sp. NBC_00669]
MRTAREGVLGARISIAAPDAVDFGTFHRATGAAFALLHRVEEAICAPRQGSSIRLICEGLLGAADLDGHLGGRENHEARELCETLRAVGERASAAWDGGGRAGGGQDRRGQNGRGQDGRGRVHAGQDGGVPRFDPREAVKCWAAERASALLAARGLTRHVLNAGGDLRLRSDAGAGAAWRVRLAHPPVTGGLLATLEIREGAVATCQTAERAASVRAPATGPGATGLTQVTVTGPDLARADLHAAAAMAQPTTARARAWLDRLAAATPYQALSVDTRGRIHATSGLAGLIRLEGEPAAGGSGQGTG